MKTKRAIILYPCGIKDEKTDSLAESLRGLHRNGQRPIRINLYHATDEMIKRATYAVHPSKGRVNIYGY